MEFKNLGIHEDLVEQLTKLNIAEPTPIQESVIPQILLNKSVLVGSQTGSGKAISLCEPTEQALLDETQKLMKQCIPLILSHPFMTAEVTKVLSGLAPPKTAKGKKKK